MPDESMRRHGYLSLSAFADLLLARLNSEKTAVHTYAIRTISEQSPGQRHGGGNLDPSYDSRTSKRYLP